MIRELLERNRTTRLRIAVIGDVMRDEYSHGEMISFSQEAPVPILRTSSHEPYAVPGGAGNVARQFRHWNADVQLLGLLDVPTSEVLDQHRIDTEFSLLLRHGQNPVKRRLYAGDHLLLRQDIERPNYGEPDLPTYRKDLLRQLRILLAGKLDAVILSDYAKGLFDYQTLRAVIETCNDAGVPTIVDPKVRHSHDYAGCTVFKPNGKYLREKGGPFDYPGILYWFKKTLAPTSALVCTRGEEPPVGYYGGPDRDKTTDFTCNLRYHSVPVKSVIGAGDCFIAHLALAIAHKIPIPDAAEFAYSAGRAYVQYPHNRPVMPHELHADIDPAGAKIVTSLGLKYILDTRYPKARIVFSNGVFRIPHSGHAATLQWARQQGDVLIVAVNSDASARVLRGPEAYIMPWKDRARMLASLGCVDFVVPFDEPTPESLIRLLRPNLLVKGPDYAGDPAEIPGHDLIPETRTAPHSGVGLHASTIIDHCQEARTFSSF